MASERKSKRHSKKLWMKPYMDPTWNMVKFLPLSGAASDPKEPRIAWIAWQTWLDFHKHDPTLNILGVLGVLPVPSRWKRGFYVWFSLATPLVSQATTWFLCFWPLTILDNGRKHTPVLVEPRCYMDACLQVNVAVRLADGLWRILVSCKIGLRTVDSWTKNSNNLAF